MNTVRALAAANDNPVLETGARLGYGASGVLHLLLGWIALAVAWRGYGGQADQSGALGTLAGSAAGLVLLWLLVAGFAALALWQLVEAFVRRDTGARIKSAGKVVVYVALALAALGVVRGSGGSGGATSMTADLMAQPFGRIMVGAVGLGVVAIGVYHVVKGWKKTFLRDLREHPGPLVVRLGRAGYVAKGIALAVTGGLLVTAATGADAQRAQGLDAALRALGEAPFGKVLLTLVALGLLAYGAYAFARARYARV